MSSEGNLDFWRVLASFIVPPLGVFLQVGLGTAFWINLVLTIVGFGIAGSLHALWVISNTGPNGTTKPDGSQTFVSLLLCGFLPPLGVFMKRGAGIPLIVNIVLTVLGFGIAGSLHALWLITSDNG